jgi:hypothetical protein
VKFQTIIRLFSGRQIDSFGGVLGKIRSNFGKQSQKKAAGGWWANAGIESPSPFRQSALSEKFCRALRERGSRMDGVSQLLPPTVLQFPFIQPNQHPRSIYSLECSPHRERVSAQARLKCSSVSKSPCCTCTEPRAPLAALSCRLHVKIYVCALDGWRNACNSP